MIFEKNAGVGEPDIFDRSGMWINRKGSDFEVIDVIGGGPAASAGISVGDLILDVDGISTEEISLPDLRRRFRSDLPGTVFHLRIKRDLSEWDLTLILEDLV
ncbi:MAG: hypothetical protein A2Z06_02820 [Candidatus Glassbacteria bacterium RBG_16_58_8]|uniref:PDZ domain-containing protein n=1 Tax=Candidatus Glassbacteria bacterium RBG_16_58_8 TaxID=1817866 RepID=A0A1F5YCS8_9BACT|nr:MAG: hypothetical protein A2Z06_02820 [Candidatus Glassbacteria bacterium RBG_16_58_8]